MLLMTHWSIMSRSLIPLENSFGRSTDILKNCSSPCKNQMVYVGLTVIDYIYT